MFADFSEGYKITIININFQKEEAIIRLGKTQIRKDEIDFIITDKNHLCLRCNHLVQRLMEK